MNRQNIDSVLRSLRRVNLQGSFLGQTVAVRFGLSESDIETLEQLIDMGATTAGRLSEITGLTSGAVTRVIDRLEQAGYVRRIPDPADRRRVIVEVVPERIASIQSTLDRVSSASAKEIGRYTDAQLSLIADFLTKMEQVTREEAAALRDSSEPTEGGSEHAAPVGGLDRSKLLFRGGVNEVLITGRPRSTTSIARISRARSRRCASGTGSSRSSTSDAGTGRRATCAPTSRSTRASRGTSRSPAEPTASRPSSPRSTSDRSRSTGGANQLRLTLGRPKGDVPIRLSSSNQIRIERPAGTAIRMRVAGGVANMEFDRLKLGPLGGHPNLESPGAGDAADRYTVDISGGVSRLTVAEVG